MSLADTFRTCLGIRRSESVLLLTDSKMPDVEQETTFELRTAIEYRSLDDMETVELVSYLTVYPDGAPVLAVGKESQKSVNG